jgi:hypothetical protein
VRPRGRLTIDERSTLEQLLHELEQDEWKQLRPGLKRLYTEQVELRKRCGQLRSQNALLAVLLERQESLLARGKAQLAELRSEHDLLKTTYEHITGQPLAPSS